MDFLGVDLSGADRWIEAARTRALTTVADHNGMVAALLMSRDMLADPARVLGRTDVLNLPTAPYTGTDPAWRGKRVPVIGAVQPPDHWRMGGQAPADAPAWVRASDTDRRNLYGAVSALLDDLRDTHHAEPQSGAVHRASGFLPLGALALIVVGVVAVGGIGLYFVNGAVATRIREAEATQRYGEQLARALEAYRLRLQQARDTGVMPPASAVETNARMTPYNPADTSPAGRAATPQSRGDDWWASAGAALPWVAGGSLVVAALAAAWTWIKGRRDAMVRGEFE